MEFTKDELNNIEENANGIVDKYINSTWYDIVIRLIKEVRRLKKKYEPTDTNY